MLQSKIWWCDKGESLNSPITSWSVSISFSNSHNQRQAMLRKYLVYKLIRTPCVVFESHSSTTFRHLCFSSSHPGFSEWVTSFCSNFQIVCLEYAHCMWHLSGNKIKNPFPAPSEPNSFSLLYSYYCKSLILLLSVRYSLPLCFVYQFLPQIIQRIEWRDLLRTFFCTFETQKWPLTYQNKWWIWFS